MINNKNFNEVLVNSKCKGIEWKVFTYIVNWCDYLQTQGKTYSHHPSAIAEEMKMQKSVVCGYIDALEEKGLITTRPDTTQKTHCGHYPKVFTVLNNIIYTPNARVENTPLQTEPLQVEPLVRVENTPLVRVENTPHKETNKKETNTKETTMEEQSYAGLGESEKFRKKVDEFFKEATDRKTTSNDLRKGYRELKAYAESCFSDEERKRNALDMLHTRFNPVCITKLQEEKEDLNDNIQLEGSFYDVLNKFEKEARETMKKRSIKKKYNEMKVKAQTYFKTEKTKQDALKALYERINPIYESK